MRSVPDNSDPVFVCKHMKDMLVERCLVCEEAKTMDVIRALNSGPRTKPNGRYVVVRPKV
jgi:hypothetical protein